MAGFDAHANFAVSTVATAPSPATSGTSLTLASGDGGLFPSPASTNPYNVVLWPSGVMPTATNAEIVRVTARSGDTLTITRAQEGTTARSVATGWQVQLAATAKLWTDVEAGMKAAGLWLKRDFGAAGDDSTDDTAAINAWLSACSAQGKVARAEAGTYLTTGGHTQPVAIPIIGAGRSLTFFHHTGNNTFLLYDGAPNGTSTNWDLAVAGMQGVTVRGNTGASAGGIEIRDTYNYRMYDVEVGETGYTYDSGFAIKVHNYQAWCESNVFQDVGISTGSGRGFWFKRNSASGTASSSLAYNKLFNVAIGVAANGIGIDFDANASGEDLAPYNGHWEVNLWLGGNNAVGIRFGSYSEYRPWNFTFWRGESFTSAGTGKVFVKNEGTYVHTSGPVIFWTDSGGGTAISTTASGGQTILNTHNARAHAATAALPGTIGFKDDPTVSGYLSPNLAGLSVSHDSSEDTAILYGYKNTGAREAVVRGVARPYNSDAGSAFDAVANSVFVARAGGDFEVKGKLYLGGVDDTTRPQIITGTGSPAGVVSAPVGSVFLRTDGGTGTTLYVKESGTGNTGWVAK